MVCWPRRPVVDMDIGAADRGPLDLDEDIVDTGNRHRHLGEFEARPGLELGNGAHGFGGHEGEWFLPAHVSDLRAETNTKAAVLFRQQLCPLNHQQTRLGPHTACGGKSREAVPAPTMRWQGTIKDTGWRPGLRRWRGSWWEAHRGSWRGRRKSASGPPAPSGWPHRPAGQMAVRRQDRVARRRSPGARLRGAAAPAPPVRESMAEPRRATRRPGGPRASPGRWKAVRVEPVQARPQGPIAVGKEIRGMAGKPQSTPGRPGAQAEIRLPSSRGTPSLPAPSFGRCHGRPFAFDHWAIENRRICRLPITGGAGQRARPADRRQSLRHRSSGV